MIRIPYRKRGTDLSPTIDLGSRLLTHLGDEQIHIIPLVAFFSLGECSHFHLPPTAPQ